MLSGFDLPPSGVDHVELSWRSLQGGVRDIDFPASGQPDRYSGQKRFEAGGPRGGPGCRTRLGRVV